MMLTGLMLQLLIICYLQTIAWSLLQIDCISEKLSIQECRSRISAYIQMYTGNTGNWPDLYVAKLGLHQGYEANVVPLLPSSVNSFYYYDTYYEYSGLNTSQSVSGAQSCPVDIKFVLTSMNGIDDIAGTVDVSGIMQMSWFDQRLAWNETMAPYSSPAENALPWSKFIYIPSSWIWVPDITISNSLFISFEDTQVQLSSKGYLTWQRPFSATVACRLDLSLFPFDKQTCPLRLRSDSYHINGGINITSKLFQVRLSEEFSGSISWKTTTVTFSRSVFFEYFDFSVLTVFVHAERYPAVYYLSAILPNLIVTITAIAALWLPDYPTRITIEITSLLTTMAILVRLF